MSNIKFKNITIEESGLVLNFKSAEQKNILFSEIDKIYISIHKVLPIYVFLFVVISLIVIGLYFLFIDFDLILFSLLLLIVFGALKLNNYKRYEMTISLKDGVFLEQQVPLRLRYEAIDFVNRIRKELFNDVI